MLDSIPVRPALLLSGRQSRTVASVGGAFGMGCASGLVVAPCSAPVMAAVLTCVAVTKSAALGFAYLFVFSLGKCTLLVVVGVSGAALAVLPRSGMWMAWTKRVLAAMMIASAEYYLVRAGTTM